MTDIMVISSQDLFN